MVQVLPYVPGFGEKLADAIGKSAGDFTKSYVEQFQKQKDQQILQGLGDPNRSYLDKFSSLGGLSPELRKDFTNAAATILQPEAQASANIREAGSYGFGPQGAGAPRGQVPSQATTMPGTSPVSSQPIGTAEQPSKDLTPQERRKLERAEANKLIQFKGDKNPILAKQGNIGEQQLKNLEREEDFEKEIRKENLPVRQEFSDKGQAARKGIQNKEKGLELIERGNIDDPTFATIADSLPLKLGQRLLSPDTVEYKAGLVEEFSDLRNIFQGQTRVKEIELLENKIADLYLTDDQKKAILRSRIDALKGDVIREEVAEEIEAEGKPLGVLQFRKEVERRSKPKIEALFNNILDEQKSIINNAETRKKVPLIAGDPEDDKIAQQILKEAGGNPKKARELAKKKGYTI
jgi:hypothetical protein